MEYAICDGLNACSMIHDVIEASKVLGWYLRPALFCLLFRISPNVASKDNAQTLTHYELFNRKVLQRG